MVRRRAIRASGRVVQFTARFVVARLVVRHEEAAKRLGNIIVVGSAVGSGGGNGVVGNGAGVGRRGRRGVGSGGVGNGVGVGGVGEPVPRLGPWALVYGSVVGNGVGVHLLVVVGSGVGNGVVGSGGGKGAVGSGVVGSGEGTHRRRRSRSRLLARRRRLTVLFRH